MAWSPTPSSPARSGWATAYNHNIDTGPGTTGVISARLFKDRMETLSGSKRRALRCSGGIVGMGETLRDRAGMLATLANLPEHPESVPINSLVAVEGTPLEDQSPWTRLTLRTIAVARLMMPQARSALRRTPQPVSRGSGARLHVRRQLDLYGDRLLTTDNPTSPQIVSSSLRWGSPLEGHTRQRGRHVRTRRSPPRPLMSVPSERLSALERQELRRGLALASVDLSSNNVLGLSQSRGRRGGARSPGRRPPTGSTGSRLLSGHSSLVDSSAALRRGKGEASLYFGSSCEDIGLLAGRDRAGRYRLERYSIRVPSMGYGWRGTVRIIHISTSARTRLRWRRQGGAWVVVESVYSMDETARRSRAWRV